MQSKGRHVAVRDGWEGREWGLRTQQGKSKVTRKEIQDELTVPKQEYTPFSFWASPSQPRPCLRAPVHPQPLRCRQPGGPRACWDLAGFQQRHQTKAPQLVSVGAGYLWLWS